MIQVPLLIPLPPVMIASPLPLPEIICLRTMMLCRQLQLTPTPELQSPSAVRRSQELELSLTTSLPVLGMIIPPVILIFY